MAPKKQDQPSHPLPVVSNESIQAIFRLADEYVGVQPWKTIGNADIFNVVDEANGQSAWAVVLGHGGEVFGLALYRGLLGLSQLHELFKSEDGIPKRGFDYVASLDLLNYNWVPARELNEIDGKVLALAGRPVDLRKRQHQFQSYRPGYVAWALDEGETRFLARGMQAALALKRALDDGINPFVEGLVPSFTFTKQGTLDLGLVKPGVWQPPLMEPPSLAPARDEAIRQAPRSGTWQAGHFFAQGQVMDGARPYHLHFMAFVDRESGYAFPPNAFGPSDNVAQKFIDCLADVVEREKVAPATIELSDRRLLQAVSPLLSRLGMAPAYRMELLALDELGETFRLYLARPPEK